MQTIDEKAKGIRLLALDVDGVLTNGTLIYGSNNLECKAFNIYDGLGMRLMQRAGINLAIISGKSSAALTRRLDELNISHRYLDCNEKLPAYQQLKEKLNVSDEEIAYVGDDLPDLPIFGKVGLSITVPNAPTIMHEYADMVTKSSGGSGAVREVCELILKAQNRYENMLQSYIQTQAK